MKNKKLRVWLVLAIVAMLSFAIAFSIPASALITDAELTEGRAFEDGEAIQIGKDLTEMPHTYEAVVYVPADVDQHNAILSNYHPLGGIGHIDFAVRMGGGQARPALDIIDQNNNRTRVEFKTEIRGDAWMHIVITHEQNDSGDIYTCYVNGTKITNKSVTYWVDGTGTKDANLTHDLDMEYMQEGVSMYVGQAFGYNSVTELGPEDPYNKDGEYLPTNFKGRIKNIALYSDVLTESEVKANYNSGINAKHEDIMLCYDLTEKEEKSGYITDISGNGYDTIPLYHERTEALDPDSYDYAFALLGDTQSLVDWDVKNGTSYTADIFNWLVANKDAKKIAQVIGVGDIVESGRFADDKGNPVSAEAREHAENQWEYAASLYAKLESAGIQYTITWGYNHDGGHGEEFTTYFGNTENFSGTDLGYYFSDATSEDYNKRLANYYRNFEVCGVKYMIMCIEYVPDDAVLSWADAVIKANPDRKVILNTHYFLDQHGEIASDYNGIQPKWDRLANENKNVEMIVCGHIQRQANLVRSYTVAKSGQTVAQFLLDPQHMDTFYGYDDTGVVAMFYFSEGGEDVRVELVSTAASMRAKEADPNAEDILYGRKNEFSFGPAGEKKPEGSMGEVDIYVIAGQSNAVGYGRGDLTVNDDRFTNGFENVLYYGNHEYFGSDDIDGFIPVKTGLGQGTGRSGAEIGIAYKLNDNGRTTVVIKCAQGATPIYPIEGNTTLEKYGSWTSPSYMAKYPELVYHDMVGAMYERLITTLRSGMGKLEADGYTLNVKGVFWMQGEAETSRDYVAAAYEELLTDLIIDLRGDLTEISGTDCSETPVVVGEITSNHINVPAYVDTVCAAQLAVADKMENVYVLDTTGLEQQDSWHYVAESQRIIGERFVDIVSSANGDYVTSYGDIPASSYDPVNKPLAVFTGGEYISSFVTWVEALDYIKNTIGLSAVAPDAKTAQIVLLSDFAPTTYHNISQMGGTVVVDLNGFKFTASADIFNGNCKPGSGSKMCTTTLIFKNGDIILCGKKAATELYVPENATGDKTISYTFENVNFSFGEGASAGALTIGNGTNKGSYNIYADLTFNGCSFDLSTNAKSGAKMFVLNKTEIIGTVKINGGKIIKDTCTSGSLFSVDSADTVTFGTYNGAYTELVLPTGVTPASEKFDANGSYSGKLMFAKTETGATADTYQLVEITTKYGDIPTEYLSVEDYPFVLFVFNGDTLDTSKTKGYSLLHGNTNKTNKIYYAISDAKDAIKTNVYSAENGYEGQYSAVILMRRDYTLGKSETYYNHGQICGVITYDLGGYTLSQSSEEGAQSIMYIQNKPTAIPGTTDPAPSFIRIINGNMVTYSKPIVTMAVTPSSTDAYTISEKPFGITFENVNFSLGEGATTTTLMLGYGTTNIKPTTYDPNPMGKFDIEFHDCYIDLFHNVKTGNFELFNLAPTTKNGTSVNVKFFGGELRGREWDGSGSGCNIKVWRNAPTNGSTFYFEKSNTTGEYFSIYLTPGADAPLSSNVFYTESGSQLTFKLESNTGVSSVYTLVGGETTKYGTIPGDAGSATDYPFVLFVYPAGSDTPVYVGAYKELLGVNNGVFNYAKGQLQDNEWNGSYDGQIRAVILMRRDYTLGEGEYYSNFAQIRGEIILDLDGHTLSQYSSASAKPLFGVASKPWGTDGTADGHADVFPSVITIENGTILTYNGAVFKLSISSTSTSPESLANKLFTINMNGVTIGLKEGATATELMFSYGNAGTGSDAHDKDIAPFIFNLNNCVIDLNTVKPAGNMTIFNLNGASKYVSTTVNMMGGEIKLDSANGVTVASKIGSGSSLTFVKGEGYTTLTVVNGSAPADKFNTTEGEMVFNATDVAGKYELTAAHTHSYSAVVTAPTCTAGGYTTYTCSCGDTYVGDYTDKVEHDYDYIVVDPECTTQGYTIFICYYCDYTYTGAYTDALGHSYNAVVTAPTCTEGGYTTYTCACGDSYVADYTEAIGHAYDDEYDADCNNCGEIREVEVPVYTVAEGACGVNTTWVLTSDGVLTISGNGDTEDYLVSITEEQPYRAYADKITKVVIEEGVTSIGRGAFYGFTNITEVVLPESLIAIHEYAFFGCTGIKTIDIPANTFYIGMYAFRKSGLTEMTFANAEGWKFADGTVLDVTNVKAFTTENTYKQTCMRPVYEDGEVIASGVYGNKDQFTWSLTSTGLLTVSGNGAMPKFNVNTTPWYGYRGAIRSVVIEEGITSVGRCSFHTCRAITSVTLPESLETIAEYAFYNCQFLTEATIPANVTRIEIYAFRKCFALKNVTFTLNYGWTAGDAKVSATELNSNAADMLTLVNYTKIWTRDINAEEEILDPNYVTGGACNTTVKWSLTYTDDTKTKMKLTISGTGAMPKFETAGTPWYGYLDNIVEVEVCEGITEIGRCSFYGLKFVKVATIADTVTSINDYAFSGCFSLKSIEIPASVTYIADTAFTKTGLSEIPTV